MMTMCVPQLTFVSLTVYGRDLDVYLKNTYMFVLLFKTRAFPVVTFRSLHLKVREIDTSYRIISEYYTVKPVYSGHT